MRLAAVMTSHRVEISSKGPSGNTQEAPLSLIDPAIGRRFQMDVGVCDRGVEVLGERASGMAALVQGCRPRAVALDDGDEEDGEARKNSVD